MHGGGTLCPVGEGSWPFYFGQQNVFYSKNSKVYNTLCPAKNYNANLDRTKIINKGVTKLDKKKGKAKKYSNTQKDPPPPHTHTHKTTAGIYNVSG